jgi:uncharacterized sporulation protein YeaH/YhbH (DUF444 family)
MLTPDDLTTGQSLAEAVLTRTDNVCGSTSLNEYRAHLASLDEQRDAIAQLRNLAKKEIHRWQDIERELSRLEKKISDHRDRCKASYNDLRFSRPPSPPFHV